MKGKSFWQVTLLLPLAVSLACEVPNLSAEGLEIYARFNESHWNAEEQRLESLNCDINSEEASEYRQCIQDEYIEAASTAGREDEGMGDWQWKCRELMASIPGCDIALDMLTGGDTTGDEITLPTSGQMVSACPSRLPYWCPPGDSDCTETYDDYLVIDFENQTFTYEYDYDFNDPREDETQTEGTYYRGHGEGATTGTLFDGGWLLGSLNHTASSERVSDEWGVPGEAEFAEASRSSTFLGVIDWGHPLTVRFCEFDMGEPTPTTLTDGMKQQLHANCQFVCTLEVRE